MEEGGFEFGKLFILSQFSIGAKFDHFNRFLRFAFSFEDAALDAFYLFDFVN